MPWITVNPTSGTSPRTILVSVDPTGKAPGQYRGDISIQGIENPGISENVEFASAGCRIAMTDLYEGVEFGQNPPEMRPLQK